MLRKRIFFIDRGTTNSCVAELSNGNIAIVGQGNRTPTNLVVQAGEISRFVEGPLRNHDIVIQSTKLLLSQTYESLCDKGLDDIFGVKIKGSNDGMAELVDPVPNTTLRKLEDIENEIMKTYLHLFYRHGPAGEYAKIVFLSIPVTFGLYNRLLLQRAASNADLMVEGFFFEPVAAFLFHQPENQYHKAAVYDLGGGTFDVTVVDDNNPHPIIAVAGDPTLGGCLFDKQIFLQLQKLYTNCEDLHRSKTDTHYDFRLAHFLNKIRAAKEELVDQANNSSYEAYVQCQCVEGTHDDITLTMDLVNDVISKYIHQTVELLYDILDKSNSLPGSTNPIEVIILVGGSSAFPIIRELLKQKFPGTKLLYKDRFESVVKGMANYYRAIPQNNPYIVKISLSQARVGVAIDGVCIWMIQIGDELIKRECRLPVKCKTAELKVELVQQAHYDIEPARFGELSGSAVTGEVVYVVFKVNAFFENSLHSNGKLSVSIVLPNDRVMCSGEFVTKM